MEPVLDANARIRRRQERDADTLDEKLEHVAVKEKPSTQAYEEPSFKFSGDGEPSQAARLGFMGGWPHPQAKAWGEQNWRMPQEAPSVKGLRQCASAVPTARPRLPWNQVNDIQSRYSRAQSRKEKREREGLTFIGGKNKERTLISKAWQPRQQASAQGASAAKGVLCGEGFSRSLQQARSTQGRCVTEVLGPRRIVTSPGVTAALVTDPNSTLYHRGTDMRNMLATSLKGSPMPHSPQARRRAATPLSELVQPVYTPLGAPQPTILPARTSPVSPPTLTGIGIFSNFQICRSKHIPGSMENFTPEQLLEYAQAMHNVNPHPRQQVGDTAPPSPPTPPPPILPLKTGSVRPPSKIREPSVARDSPGPPLDTATAQAAMTHDSTMDGSLDSPWMSTSLNGPEVSPIEL